MRRKDCDRCKKPTHGKTIMSMFNQQVICMPCKEKEQQHRDYAAASKAERDSGDPNFPGMGLPKDLFPEDL